MIYLYTAKMVLVSVDKLDLDIDLIYLQYDD